jgi:hypothetical protein
MNDQITSAIRTLLKAGGGFLVAKGAVSGDNLDIVISAVMILGGALWSAWHHAKNPSQPTPVK